MMPKRYRDHGRHQLNVAAVADLLWMASAPTEDYTRAVTVAQAIKGKNPLWNSPEHLRDLSVLAVLAHDHGYALLQVAWLLGRLYTMKLKRKDPSAEKLAEALMGYVEPFASTWFNDICDKMRTSTSEPCHFIS